MTGWADLAGRDDVPADPFEVLEAWLPPNEDPNRPTMTVITAGADGMPDGRIQLLSEFDRDGFSWHTDSRSRKLEQLAENPKTALVIFLPEQLQQVTVQGVAEELDAASLARVYAARSPYLRELAYLNTPEFAAKPLAERVAEWAAFDELHRNVLEPPVTWTGRRVRPSRITLWSGRPDTASRRVEYSRGTEGADWTVEILAG